MQPQSAVALKEVNLDVRMIYEALVESGTIDVTGPPPDRWHSGDRIHTAMYYAYYENPRGIKPARDRKCWRATTTCVYARIIATIRELTNHVLTKEKINMIDVDQLCETYHFTQLIVGSSDRVWCNTYSLYVFACAHIETYCHACSPMCPALGYIQKQDDDEINQFVTHHMQTYDHAKLPSVTQVRAPNVATGTVGTGTGSGSYDARIRARVQGSGSGSGSGSGPVPGMYHRRASQVDGYARMQQQRAPYRARMQSMEGSGAPSMHTRAPREHGQSYYSREPSREFTLVSNDVGVIEPVGE
jgi:hypothetical protein